MKRAYYSDTINKFVKHNPDEILGVMTRKHVFDLDGNQRDAWIKQTTLLQNQLTSFEGQIYLEFSIPRMGKRVDVLLMIGSVIIILEFKIGEKHFLRSAKDQVTDYALDLSNFHEGSHQAYIVPILIATDAPSSCNDDVSKPINKLFEPLCSNGKNLNVLINNILAITKQPKINIEHWESSGYKPTPTIIEATLLTRQYNSSVIIGA